MKNFKRLLALALVLCMTLSVMPLSTFAADDGETTVTPADTYRILHLDNGRKYYTKDWIVALLNEMAADGYTHLQLAFGNDGMRFLLDDMSFTANGVEYSHDAVTAAFQKANADYYDFGTNELTEAEMDEIIAHAKSVGIGIIPLVNNPGHMDAIVAAFNDLQDDDVSYQGSESTIDLEDDNAVAMTKALLQKYIEYFASKGCNEFHMGADEYANDIYSSGSMGFGALMTSGKYQLFVDYVNEVSAMIKKAGMVPMAFNDGIYFQGQTGYTFDTDLMISFWSSGWGSYYSASASTMANMGHPMINTHGDWYYILGKNDTYTPDETTSHTDASAYTQAAGFSNTAFMSSTVSAPQGSTFCIWADYPGTETETEVAANVRLIMRAMGLRMQDQSIDGMDTETVVAGGFNADGTVNVVAEPEVPETTDPQETTTPETTAPVVETVTKKDDATGVSVAAPGLSGLIVNETTAPTIEGAVHVKAWEMVPATAEGNYTGKAVVSVPVPEDWNTANMGAFVITDGQVELLTGTYADGYFTYTCPHFSTSGIYDAERTYTDVTSAINLVIGEKTEIVVDGADYTSDFTVQYTNIATATAEYEQVEGSTVTTLGDMITPSGTNNWSDTGVIKSGDYYLVMSSTGKLSATQNIAEATVFTVTRANNNDRWTIASGSYYLRYNNGNLIGSTDSSNWRYSNGFYSGSGSNNYLTYSNNSWTVAQNANNKAYLYDVTTTTTDPVNQTTVTVTGVAAGTTYVTVGNSRYTVNVKYNEKTITVVKNATQTDEQSVTVGDYTEDTSATGTYSSAAWSGNTVTFTAGGTVGTDTYTIGNTIYTVKVTEENLDDVDPVIIEMWITNSMVTPSDGTSYSTGSGTNTEYKSYEYTYVSVGAKSNEAINTEAGCDVSELVAKTGAGDLDRVFWKTTYLDLDVVERQDNAGGKDNTLKGDDFAKIRYWNGSWAYFSIASNEWIAFSDADNYQLVAYYLQESVVTSEITTRVVDWGPTYKSWKEGGDSWFFGGSSYVYGGHYIFLDYAVVYEDGTQNPSSFPTNNTAFFHADGISSTPRVIGASYFVENSDYEIWKVTVTTGTSSGYTSASNFTSTYDDTTETVVWDESMDGEPYVPSLTYTAEREGKLVRVYVRAKVTPDALTVHYLDKTANNLEFYSYNIAVNANNGTKFDENFGMGTEKNTLVNNTVVNIRNVTQTVSADLATMPEIKVYYRYCDYTLVNTVRSDDGKHVYLYYTFTPVVSFVVDYGTPITITPDQLIKYADGKYNADLSYTSVTSVKVIGTYDTEMSASTNATYGTVAVDGTNVVYTPVTLMQGVDFFTIHVVADDSERAYRVYVVPATTVNYEEGFLENWTGTWTDKGGKSSVNQTTQILGFSSDNYGFDSNITSNGTDATTSTLGAASSFTFTGTGFEVFANCTEETGYVSVEIKNAAGEIQKISMVNTVVKKTDVATDATIGQTGTFNAEPIVSFRDLAHGTYTVTLRKVMDAKPINIDGFRVYGTVEELEGANSVYYADKEDHPEYYELRDAVLHAVGVNNTTSVYGTPKSMANQIYNAAEGAAAIILDESITYASSDTVQDLLDNGPKNEILLYAGQTLTFKVTTSRLMQIGLRAPNGTANCTISVTGEDAKNLSISKTVDMFYDLNSEASENKGYTVTISNKTGSDILAVTLLKICDDPNATFVELTAEDIEAALIAMGYTDSDFEAPETTEPETTVPETTVPETTVPETTVPETTVPETTVPEETEPTEPEVPEEPETPVEPETPEEPEVPEVTYADASLVVWLVDYKGDTVASAQLTANGVEGETAVFTADQILAAAAEQMPENYALVDESAVTAVEVTYGKEHIVSIQAGKVTTLTITYVNLFGKKVGTATITKVQTSAGSCRITASEIRANAPSGRMVLRLTSKTVPYGTDATITVAVI